LARKHLARLVSAHRSWTAHGDRVRRRARVPPPVRARARRYNRRDAGRGSAALGHPGRARHHRLGHRRTGLRQAGPATLPIRVELLASAASQGFSWASGREVMTTTDELALASAVEQAALIRSGEVSSGDLVDLYLRRIEDLNPRLGAYLTVA